MGYFIVYLSGTFQNLYKLDTNEKLPSTNLESNPLCPAQWPTDPNASNSPLHPSTDVFPYFIPHSISLLPVEVGKGDQESFIQEATFELVPGRWALDGKDIPVRGNPTKVMIILVFKPNYGYWY